MLDIHTRAAVDASGEWTYDNSVAGSARFFIYATSNPATAFTSLDVNQEGSGIGALDSGGVPTGAVNLHVSNVELRGWRYGLYLGAGSVAADITARQISQNGIVGSGTGTYTITRPTIYDVGNSVGSNGAGQGEHGLYFVGGTITATVLDPTIDNTKEDNVQLGSTLDDASLITITASGPGTARLSSCTSKPPRSPMPILVAK